MPAANGSARNPLGPKLCEVCTIGGRGVDDKSEVVHDEGVRGACVRYKIKEIKSRKVSKHANGESVVLTPVMFVSKTLTVTERKMKNMKIIVKQVNSDKDKKLEESIPLYDVDSPGSTSAMK